MNGDSSYHSHRSLPCFEPGYFGGLHLLNYLRVQAARHRCAPRIDIANACTHISVDPEKALDAFAGTLVRSLQQATKAPALFFAPGTKTANFSEGWLVRCVMCEQNADYDSLQFLLRRRVCAYYRGTFRSLIKGVATNW